MKILKYNTGALDVNTYLVLNEQTKECVIIDYGGQSEQLLSYIKDNNYTLCGVLLTHGHFDHAGGCAAISRQGIPVYCDEKDIPMLQGVGQCNDLAGVDFDCFTANVLPEDDKITLANIDFEILRTAGHTLGGVCYKAGDTLFSGDTLFYHSCGRCDLYGGNKAAMFISIKKLLSLDKNLRVLPGHGDETSIKEERKFYGLRD